MGEEQGDEDRMEVSADGVVGYGKEAGQKGSGRVGLREQERLARPDSCKPGCEVVQPKGISGLECEGPTIFSIYRMDWALKDRETSGPKACWEEGQPI